MDRIFHRKYARENFDKKSICISTNTYLKISKKLGVSCSFLINIVEQELLFVYFRLTLFLRTSYFTN